MWFDPYDIGDPRIKECSTDVPSFPADIGMAPEKEGLFVLLDADYHVQYIGWARAGGLRAELEAKKGTGAAEHVRWFLWVETRDPGEARELMGDWARKYRPAHCRARLLQQAREPVKSGNVLSFPRRRAGASPY